MDILHTALEMITLPDQAAGRAAEKQIRKYYPPGLLGKLEDIIISIAAITGNAMPHIQKKTIINMAADHGVVAEGISAYPQAVTKQMVMNFVMGGSAMCVLSRHANAEILVVDVGVNAELPEIPQIISRKIAPGTNNFTQGPAMARAEAIKAIEIGIETVWQCIKNGTQIIGLAEKGIGNTTPSTAVLAALTDAQVESITGRGTGVNDERFNNKIRAIKQALAVNKPDKNDAIDVLHKVGGYEIAALVGVIIGAAAKRIPVIVDGLISCAAAIVAVNLKEDIRHYYLPSHLSAEPGHKLMLKYLGLEPILDMDMRLGEGTGAALAMLVIDSALNMFKNIK